MFRSKKISLQDGEITIREWINKQDFDALRRAMEKGYKGRVLNQEYEVWRLAYAIQNGEGYLKGRNVEETYAKLQELPISVANKINNAYVEFVKELAGELKKK